MPAKRVHNMLITVSRNPRAERFKKKKKEQKWIEYFLGVEMFDAGTSLG